MNILILIYGLLIGSFLNVCIYRIPRNESIVYPPSHCPNCGISLKWYDKIPIFSFIIYKGKCKYCGKKISLQYPIIEVLTTSIYILIYVKFGFTLESFFYVIIFSILIVITVIDLQYMLIPDILVMSILTSTIIYKIIQYILYKTSPEILKSIGGLILAGGIFILIVILSRGGMGHGDITLISSLGFILGIRLILLNIFLSFILGAFISTFLLITKMKTRKDPIPFGPFIVLAFFISVFWGEKLIYLYKKLFFIT